MTTAHCNSLKFGIIQPHARLWSMLLALTMLLLLSATVNARTYEHTFRFKAPANATSVSVAGSFNGWSRHANPMRHVAKRIWETRVELEEGVSYYKFVVNGDQWLNDPRSDAQLEELDGYGGVNSAILVGFDTRKLPQAKPDHILLEGLRHDPQHDASIVSQQYVMLHLRTRAEDIQRIRVVIDKQSQDSDIPPGIPPGIPMYRVGAKLGSDLYVALIPNTPPQVSYRFELVDGDATVRYPDADSKPFVLRLDTPFFHTPNWARDAVWYQIFPERFRNGDSSNDPGDGEFENLIRWQADWWKTQPGEAAGAHNFYKGKGNIWNRRYGGDMQGVIEALPYLRKLGINALYFNPVFEAESMHKYDTTDYRHVDDNFGIKVADKLVPVPGETEDPQTWGWSGSDELFLELLGEAHAQGFHVIVDGVFNHVGTEHRLFKDVLARGGDSEYASWFEITDFGKRQHYGDPKWFGKPGGIQWNAWDKPSGTLPVLRNDPATGLGDGPRQHIFEITRRWMAPDGDASRGIDGWRLDVPGDIAAPFWIQWRTLVKSINPDAYISGEIWGWAKPWLEGDQFDAVMNYQFAMAGQDFLVDRTTAIKPSELAQQLAQIAYGYKFQVALVQQNLYDSHDTDRLASMFVNPDRNYDGANRLQDNGPDYSSAKPNAEQRQRQMLAVALQMTFVGAPMIYYGSEAGMWSADDPSDRQPMVWADLEPYDDPEVYFDAEIFEGYRKLITIRNNYEALRHGLYRPIVIDDARGLFGFARDLNRQHIYVMLNRTDEAVKVNVPVDEDHGLFVNLLETGAVHVVDATDPAMRSTIEITDQATGLRAVNGQVLLKLPARTAAILVKDPRPH